MPGPSSRRADSCRTQNLTDEDRHQVVASFLTRATEGVLKRGDISAVAAKHNIHPKTAARVWERAKCEAERSGNYIAVSRIHQAGRPRQDRTAALERLRHVDLAARSTVRSAAAACGMDPSSLHRELKRGSLRSHTSVGKPALNDGNKAARLQFCLSHIDTQTMLFDDMLSTVHVEEKVFYVTEPTKRCILLPDEPEPVRKLRSKRFTTRVIFLAAVGRPRFDEDKQQLFDGKVGIWAFVKRVAAQRSSSRRPAGIPVTKGVSVTKNSYRTMLATELLPALQDRWPSSSPVTIQQDNSPAHINQTDPAFLEAVEQSDCKVTLRSQPPNSPD
ncbi:hypothetical protein BBJ28_00021415 [Nothophytophthora sp. Chile5]|nr:hypothetical protein BBJ28_00021415 [Nothophytophthora sp. Chile5]